MLQEGCHTGVEGSRRRTFTGLQNELLRVIRRWQVLDLGRALFKPPVLLGPLSGADPRRKVLLPKNVVIGGTFGGVACRHGPVEQVQAECCSIDSLADSVDTKQCVTESGIPS